MVCGSVSIKNMVQIDSRTVLWLQALGYLRSDRMTDDLHDYAKVGGGEKMTTESLIEKIKVLNLEEGDVICLTTPHSLSHEAWVRLRHDLADCFKTKPNRILLLEEGMDLKIIRSEALKAELAVHK